MQLGAIILVSFLALIPPTSAAQPPAQAEWLPMFDQAVSRVAGDPKMVGLAVAVIDRGELIYQKTFGETAIRSGDPVTEHTAFRVASVSKTFTGTLLADLASAGILDLSQPMPAEIFRTQDRQPTLAEVASHQTGLPPYAYDNDLEARVSLDRIMGRLANVDLICPVGECHTYQNLTFAALGRVIELSTEKPFEQVMQERIFDPLGMHTASFGSQALKASESWARPHRRTEATAGRYAVGEPDSPYDQVAPAAAVNASLQDMVAWAFANLGLDPALSQQTLVAAHQWLTDTPTQNRALWRLSDRIENTGYGLGWRHYLWDDRKLVTHAGYVSGYGAQILLDPEQQFAFVALWNADASSPWYLWPTLMDIRQRGEPGHWLDTWGFERE